MSSGSPEHGYTDAIYLYALGTLPPAEVPAVTAHVTACPECREELRALQPVIDAFASWPVDVLRPAPSLWERLARRIGGGTGGEASVSEPRPAEPEWRDVAPGIACKLLATDVENNGVTMLVRLSPRTDYPAHRHGGVEELYLLEGELHVDEATFHPGDYRRAEPGTVDRRVWSETGCTCVLITSSRDALLWSSPSRNS